MTGLWHSINSNYVFKGEFPDLAHAFFFHKKSRSYVSSVDITLVL